MKGNKLLNLLRSLYLFSDSGDYWTTTFSDHIKSDLELQRTVTDFSFFKKVRGKLMGVMGTYVDETIACGLPKYDKLNKETGDKFESKAKE